MKRKRILVASDFHYPYQNDIAVIKLEEYAEKFKPDYYIINGDLFDLIAFSSHRKGVINPSAEVGIARTLIGIHLNIMRKHCKKIVFLLGNHEARYYKLLLTKAPEYEHFIKADLFSFKGVTTIGGAHPEFIIDDIIFFHGASTKLGYHRERFNMNTVIGHSHKSYIDYKGYRNRILFEANSGCMCDMNSDAFSYTAMKDKGWVNSFLVIEDGKLHLEMIK